MQLFTVWFGESSLSSLILSSFLGIICLSRWFVTWRNSLCEAANIMPFTIREWRNGRFFFFFSHYNHLVSKHLYTFLCVCTDKHSDFFLHEFTDVACIYIHLYFSLRDLRTPFSFFYSESWWELNYFKKKRDMKSNMPCTAFWASSI